MLEAFKSADRVGISMGVAIESRKVIMLANWRAKIARPSGRPEMGLYWDFMGGMCAVQTRLRGAGLKFCSRSMLLVEAMVCGGRFGLLGGWVGWMGILRLMSRWNDRLSESLGRRIDQRMMEGAGMKGLQL